MGSKGKFSNSSKGKELIEELDVRGTAKSGMGSIQKYLSDISKEPAAKQAAVGGITGWVTGFISMKVGKAAATAIGGSLILIQIAAHQGYIKIDWSRVNKDLEKNAKKLQKEVANQVGATSNELVRFAQDNVVLASCFAGGVLLGISSA